MSNLDVEFDLATEAAREALVAHRTIEVVSETRRAVNKLTAALERVQVEIIEPIKKMERQ